MKKSLFIMAAAAIAVGCANENVRNDIVAEDVPIGFVPSFMEKNTRANSGEMMITPTNTINMVDNSFEVWGWKTSQATANTVSETTKVFDGQDVFYNTPAANATTGWYYTPLKYWDRNSAYDFYAAAPHNVFTLSSDKKFSITLDADKTFQVLEDMAGANKTKLAYNTDNAVTGTAGSAIDYLVANLVHCNAGAATQGNASDKDVAFTFGHILSKLTVKVLTTTDFNHTSSGDPATPRIELTDLKISLDGMATSFSQLTSGALTPTGTNVDTWATPISSAIEKVVFDVDGTKVTSKLPLSTTATSIASYLVAPTPTGASATKATVKVTAEYDVIYSDITDHCVSPETTVSTLEYFVQNTHNILNITIAPQAILFDVQTVNGFDPEAEYNVDIK